MNSTAFHNDPPPRQIALLPSLCLLLFALCTLLGLRSAWREDVAFWNTCEMTANNRPLPLAEVPAAFASMNRRQPTGTFTTDTLTLHSRAGRIGIAWNRSHLDLAGGMDNLQTSFFIRMVAHAAQSQGLRFDTGSTARRPDQRPPFLPNPADLPENRSSFLGFAGGMQRQTAPGSRDLSATLILPWWFPAALFLSYPLWLLARRWRRQKTGRCACGYDLRASQHRCPECGAPTRGPRHELSSPEPPSPHTPQRLPK